ncbi:response regulator transcription factor [Halalkalibacterium halodurans]|uniref:Two-component response regulator n=1 Tax=Halalkalibacterium halodurans (strain ATCC BAA-125 / DSM 18197 / FERM 7344 / JCM 9153 / C-125) TaxID=272558 RepID=Q9KDN9_HALH5|nr:response regulator transcription factor [Halalkalibacterium halodurans]MDY7221698.1 response regulator transcription factor [Halalkalibacterium halodurans]MDY7240974.1 response regulator transcription factor [Halalkalibacterium halodurans]MED4124305.1 response regulator transcription factor [Halalkalibacterium halodurans]MED4171593.1 response regulator transcription factor [Halalkalibacterium halodurans]BAB04891.1 two-component response regulator [Halalkalibacterium halodurans C-125]
MSEYLVHLVEDEANLSEVLKAYLEKEGWSVRVFTDGNVAQEAISEQQPHLWILDIMLPGTDGYQLLKQIKEKGDTPVIFISARDQDLDRVLGLEMGSDDYLAKPFLPQELIIRAKKLLNRVYGSSSQEQRKIEINHYVIDPVGRTVIDQENNDEAVDLTTKEMDLILLLTGDIGKAFSRERIIEHVWGENYFGSERAVDDVVRRVRKKMPRIHLETLYGYGYRVLSS